MGLADRGGIGSQIVEQSDGKELPEDVKVSTAVHFFGFPADDRFSFSRMTS
jgi:hypothetical protein